MLKKTIKYTDFNGVERTEDFYFNLTKAELTEMQLEKDGGLDTKIRKIVESKNIPEIIKMFKEIVLKAYGIKSDDGKRFMKSDKIREEFASTNAYSELFMELASNAEKASAFVNGILPTGLVPAEDAKALAQPESKNN